VVGILTKSPLVLRDVDVLRSLPRAEVGLTVTTTDDRLSRFLEVRAPLASRRLRTLAELHAEGIRTYAFAGCRRRSASRRTDKIISEAKPQEGV
jgi:DNA repair photolyase